MTIDPQTLYLTLGQLIAETPDFSGNSPITPEQNAWLGKACALVAEAGVIIDQARIDVCAQSMNGPLRHTNAQAISVILNRTLASAELKAPIEGRGAFIPVGNAFEAFVAVSKVLGTATSDVLIVDPYMDGNTLTDFAVTVPEGIHLRLLADQDFHKPGLNPAVAKWKSQYQAQRPLEVRLAASRVLHDRLIMIDGKSVYTLTQSLNAMATRSPASVVKVDPDNSSLKVAAYATIWGAAKPF